MTALLDVMLRSSAILLVALSGVALLRRRPAALRHVLLAASIAAAALVTPLSRVVPSWDVRVLPVSTAPRPALPPDPPAVSGATSFTVEDSTGSPDIVLPALTLLWACGFVILLARLLRDLACLARVSARAEPVRQGRIVRIAEQVSNACGLTRPVALLQAAAPDFPATWGFIRPRVLLPVAARDWDEDRLRAVLCHELAHVRRGDWFVQLAADLLRTVFWINPLFWIACARLRRESEQACDDAVLRAGVEAGDYAAHLLALARSCNAPASRPATALPMARPSTLERRIAAMLNDDTRRDAVSRPAALLTGAVLLALCLPVAAVRGAQDGPAPLTGSVYDPSGAVLPGVQLILQDAQEFTWQAKTDAAGAFEFPPVQPGRYVLEATLPGFRSLRHEFDLRIARDWSRAITLQVGDLSEIVTVQASRLDPRDPSRPAGPEPVRVGGNIRAPRKLYHVSPAYPVSMREAGREGVVSLEAVIGRDGRVTSLRVIGSHVHPDFGLAAVDAVQQWVFEPTLLNGVPVEVKMTVRLVFDLEG